MFNRYWIMIYKPETDTIITESKYYATVLGASHDAKKFVNFLRTGYAILICKLEEGLVKMVKEIK